MVGTRSLSSVAHTRGRRAPCAVAHEAGNRRSYLVSTLISPRLPCDVPASAGFGNAGEPAPEGGGSRKSKPVGAECRPIACRTERIAGTPLAPVCDSARAPCRCRSIDRSPAAGSSWSSFSSAQPLSRWWSPALSLRQARLSLRRARLSLPREPVLLRPGPQARQRAPLRYQSSPAPIQHLPAKTSR